MVRIAFCSFAFSFRVMVRVEFVDFSYGSRLKRSCTDRICPNLGWDLACIICDQDGQPDLSPNPNPNPNPNTDPAGLQHLWSRLPRSPSTTLTLTLVLVLTQTRI